jgi:hypothetical protein
MDNLRKQADVTDAICSIDGCGRPHKARGWCYRHYLRWWKENRGTDAVHPGGSNYHRRDPLTLIDTEGPGGCWLWTGSIGSAGYGRIVIDTKRYQAHRLIYELLVEPIPDGLEIDHLCRVRNCVNPDHLEPVTQIENLRRARRFHYGGDGGDSDPNKCVRGHRLEGDNVYRRPSRPNSRECMACRRWHAQQARKAGARRTA